MKQKQKQTQQQRQDIVINIPDTQQQITIMKYCSSCGETINQNIRFCTYCGAQQL